MSTNIKIITGAIDYTEDNLNNKLTLDEIAKDAGYSKYHLHRMFSFVTGQSIHTYIKKRKLTEAARYLVTTDTPIIDIVLGAGYGCQ